MESWLAFKKYSNGSYSLDLIFKKEAKALISEPNGSAFDVESRKIVRYSVIALFPVDMVEEFVRILEDPKKVKMFKEYLLRIAKMRSTDE